jgi:hypothetical protein
MFHLALQPGGLEFEPLSCYYRIKVGNDCSFATSSAFDNFCGNSVAQRSFCPLSLRGCGILGPIQFYVNSGYTPYKLFQNLPSTIHNRFFYK